MTNDPYCELRWGSTSSREILEHREEIAIKQLLSFASGQEATLLDMGCGDGCFLSGLSKSVPSWSLYGLDGSEAQIAKAKSRLPQGQFELATFGSPIPFESNSFDFVFSGEVLEHLVDPDQYLAEALRVLKPGGYILLTTPNLMAWYNRILILCGVSPVFVEYSTRDARIGYGPLKGIKSSQWPVGHLRIFHPSALLDLVSSLGFENPCLQSARFDFMPRQLLWLDSLISRFWTRGGSILIVSARKLSKPVASEL